MGEETLLGYLRARLREYLALGGSHTRTKLAFASGFDRDTLRRIEYHDDYLPNKTTVKAFMDALELEESQRQRVWELHEEAQIFSPRRRITEQNTVIRKKEAASGSLRMSSLVQRAIERARQPVAEEEEWWKA